jgi:formylglycine-generating enzyme required for sulfatase activity
VYNLWRQDGHLISPWSDKSSLPCHLVFVQQMDKVQYRALDMPGNVWEWVNDWPDWEYYARSPYRNLSGPETGTQRELRGGSFHYGLGYMRAATRHSAPPGHRADALGFRCAMPEAQR